MFRFILESYFLLLTSFSNYPSILGATVTSPVKVSASIPYCPNIIITPENRLPPTHNNALEITIDIRPENSSTSLYTGTIGTDNEGKGQICPMPLTIISGQYYDVLVKGISHLRRIFPHQYFNGSNFTLDLSTPVLLAGDSHPSSDNYVNSLDISYEILKIYTSELRADLNRDGLVNSLEFPTLISHLYKNGDN